MKRFIIGLLVILILIGGVTLVLKETNTKIIVYEQSGYSENSNGLVTGTSFDIISNVNEDYIKGLYSNYVVTLTEGDNVNTYNYSEFGIETVVNDNVKEYINSHFILESSKLKVDYTHELLNYFVDTLNETRYESKYASLEKGESNFILTDEVIGNYLNTKELYDYIVENIGKANIEVDLTEFYTEFDPKAIRYEQLKEEVDKINNTYVAYTNGYKIGLIDLYEYLILENNKISLDTSQEEIYKKYIDKTIETELIEYDTVGKARTFTTTSGETIEVSGGTWGDIFSSDLETEYILEKFSRYENEENRLPIYSQDYSNEIPDTYIEVSLTEQHVWYYENGELIIDTPCVTGTKGKSDTPTGVYFISEKVDGKYLRGDGYVTWVDKWMRITNRGHGFHDAQWRASREFEPTRYTWDGSHGCINLPKDFAYKLFDNIEVGTCAVIY